MFKADTMTQKQKKLLYHVRTNSLVIGFLNIAKRDV